MTVLLRFILPVCLCLFSVFLSAGPKASAKEEAPKAPAIAMKEKALPPAGMHYLYIDPSTPRYLIEKARAKKLQFALSFDQRQAAWLRGILPSLSGMTPILFVRGVLSDMEEKRLRETLEHFNYEATLVHIKQKDRETLPLLPIKGLVTVERTMEKERTVFVIQQGKQTRESAKLLSLLDERDLSEPFTVASGLIFERHGFRFINIDAVPDTGAAVGDRTIVFFSSEKGAEKFIEKW